MSRETTGHAARAGVLGLFLYCLAWGVVVEAVDRAFGDSFDALDAATHAFWVLAAILVLPFFAHAWSAGRGRGRPGSRGRQPR